MAFGHLDTPVHLVPWQQHGVDFILTKENLPLGFSLCHTQQTPSPQNNIPNTQVSPSAQPLQQAQPNKVQSRPQVRRTYAQDIAPAQAHNPTPTNANLFLPPEHWPKPWQELLQKTAPAPVVWTYWNLGEDLTGNASDERRAFLRKILGDLALPKGTNAFWPAAMSLQNGQEPMAHTQAFWSGVQMLKARAVVVMGQPATKALELPPDLRPFMQARHNGCFVVVLRDVDLLISEPHLYANVREFLRKSLAAFAKR